MTGAAGRAPRRDAPESPGEPEILVAATPTAAAALAAERLVRAIDLAVARRGRADIATTGGSTCPELYRALLARPLRDRIPWDRLHLWFGDDRFVPRSDPESNLQPVDTVLLAGDAVAGLEPAPLPLGNVHPVPVDATLAVGGGPADAAASYEARSAPSCRPMPPGGRSSTRSPSGSGPTATCSPSSRAAPRSTRPAGSSRSRPRPMSSLTSRA